LFCWSKKRCQ